MTAQPLAPVIPSSAVPAGRRRARSSAGRPLPLARPTPAPSLPEHVVYGIGRIDGSGRIDDQTVISALGWRGGDRLTPTVVAGIVTARLDPGGMITLPGRAYIAIPAELRRRWGLHSLVTGCCWPQSRQATRSMHTRSPWRIRPSAPTARSRIRKEKRHDHHPDFPAASQQAAVEAALLVLERMGLSPDDLTATCRNRAPVPTRKAYGSYWNRVVEQWGARRLDEPTPSEIKQLVAYVRANTAPRRNARGGGGDRSAAEDLIAALRCLYRHAQDDGLIDERDDPARKVDEPAVCRPPAGLWPCAELAIDAAGCS